MDTFTDYYATLGIKSDASLAEIKTAFKKLALQYHPDVYKGSDAQERMRLLLQAYQTLSNPTARRQYDAHSSEHLDDGFASHAAFGQKEYTERPRSSSYTANGRTQSEVSPSARRDRQRRYAFPDLSTGQTVEIDLVDFAYTLSPDEGQELLQKGLLRGFAPEVTLNTSYCHRCHHRWATQPGKKGYRLARSCPRCGALDWPEYLLLRCVHCRAVFESEQIRYAIGAYIYGTSSSADSSGLCPPYELFPLCPYCGKSHWSPAEDARVQELGERAQRRANRWRWLGMFGSILPILVIVGVMTMGLFQ